MAPARLILSRSERLCRHGGLYGHLFAQDRASLLAALNQAVGRPCAYENHGDPGAETAA